MWFKLYANEPITVWNKYACSFCAVAQNAESASFNLATFLISVSSCTNASSTTRQLDKYFILLGFSTSEGKGGGKKKVSSGVTSESYVVLSKCSALQDLCASGLVSGPATTSYHCHTNHQDEAFAALWQEAEGGKSGALSLGLSPVNTLIATRLKAVHVYHFLWCFMLCCMDCELSCGS